METFEMLEGYDAAYEEMLRLGLEGLDKKAQTSGLTFQEDNMRYQLKVHLGIPVDLVSQREDTPKTKDIGIESYN